MRDQLQQRLTELRTEQQEALTRVTALDQERGRLLEQIVRREGAIAELEALCHGWVVATKEDGGP
jgi:predicted nuclease with TOPRIM domain